MTHFFRRAAAALLALTLTMAIAAPTAAPVSAQSSDEGRYAAIVVDATNGEVLFARRADSPRFPASVTKMMTLYLVFEALSTGRVSLDDELTVSPLAASQAPSKLGLAAGQKIRLDDAMRATAVRSCNDMAMALAEYVGGSQARFAAMATQKAQQLGMTGTRYVNPNGLPDSRQITTARDLAVLARAIMRDYPQYYSYFGLHDWVYGGREYHNTNGLLLGGNGYDGIKTGFTNASGYNLAASAVRDGRRIIVIVLGGRTTASRNAHVAGLMDTGFEIQARRAHGERIQVAQAFFEERGYGIGGADTGPPVAYASLVGENGEDGEDGEGARPYSPPTQPYGRPYMAPAGPLRAPSADPALRPRAYASLPPATVPAAPTSDASITATLNGAPTGRATATPSRPANSARATPPRPPAGRWAVQVGAFRNERVARDWLTEVNRRFRSQFAHAEREVQTAAGWYRSRFTGMTEDAAKDACEALDARRVTCSVIRPGA